MSSGETIYALSSGQPPAAIGIIRISGDKASDVLAGLADQFPQPRIATLLTLTKTVSDDLLDESLCLWFPGPKSASGEDLVEIHCHGGRAVIRAIESELEQIDGLRRAEPGEFTRRAFLNGRIDLAEAEGLSDLLFAETELQRRSAIRAAGGSLSRRIEEWQQEILRISAMVEAELDFSDEDDVTPAQVDVVHRNLNALGEEMEAILRRPRAEKLREGVRVVLGGPPNCGKSTLLNGLVEREAAIVSDIAGTTRDAIEVPVALDGIPFLFIDTAGVRDQGAEEIERMGIDRARREFELADVILWLGAEGEGPEHKALIEVASRADHPDFHSKSVQAQTVSAITGRGMDDLVEMLIKSTKDIIPSGDEITINARQAEHLAVARLSLTDAAAQDDFLVLAEQLRIARAALDALTGKASTEDMLDALFGKFCIGK